MMVRLPQRRWIDRSLFDWKLITVSYDMPLGDMDTSGKFGCNKKRQFNQKSNRKVIYIPCKVEGIGGLARNETKN